jgi:hypothetical protein
VFAAVQVDLLYMKLQHLGDRKEIRHSISQFFERSSVFFVDFGANFRQFLRMLHIMITEYERSAANGSRAIQYGGDPVGGDEGFHYPGAR